MYLYIQDERKEHSHTHTHTNKRIFLIFRFEKTETFLNRFLCIRNLFLQLHLYYIIYQTEQNRIHVNKTHTGFI